MKNESLACDQKSVVMSVLLLLVVLSLVFMALPRERSFAASRQCAMRLKKLAFGVHEYHQAFRRFPPGCGGTVGGDSKSSNQGRLSGFAALLPFIGEQAAWEQLANGDPDSEFPAMGPSPSISPDEYTLWGTQFEAFLCPEERELKRDFGLRSYLFNYGDGIDLVGQNLFVARQGRSVNREDEIRQRCSCRGPFMPGKQLAFRDLKDGMTNTILFGESVVDVSKITKQGSIAREVNNVVNRPDNVLELVKDGAKSYSAGTLMWSVGKGLRWAEGHVSVNGFTTVLPPGSPSATMTGQPHSGVFSASSHHAGGAQVSMADGAIKFIADTIDTGDLTQPSVSTANGNCGKRSPYGVWGAMGSRSGVEIIPSEREADYHSVPKLF